MNFLIAAAPSTGGEWAALGTIALSALSGIGFLGRWFLKRIETLESDNKSLYGTMIQDVLPALSSSTNLAEKILNQQKELTATHNELIAKLEVVNKDQALIITQQAAVISSQQELHKQELAFARRKGAS